jgi:hypothetical protein
MLVHLLADKVSISLLLLSQKSKVLLNLEAHDGGGLVCQIVLELLGLHHRGGGGGERGGELRESDARNSRREAAYADWMVLQGLE